MTGYEVIERIMDALMEYVRANAVPTAFVSLMTTAKLIKSYASYGFLVRDPQNPGILFVGASEYFVQRKSLEERFGVRRLGGRADRGGYQDVSVFIAELRRRLLRQAWIFPVALLLAAALAFPLSASLTRKLR